MAANEGTCNAKFNQNVYVASNDLSCLDDPSDINLSVIERYKTKQLRTSDFNITGTLSLIIT